MKLLHNLAVGFSLLATMAMADPSNNAVEKRETRVYAYQCGQLGVHDINCPNDVNDMTCRGNCNNGDFWIGVCQQQKDSSWKCVDPPN